MLKFFSKLDFPAYFYHYKKGGHVAALHAHIENALFFKIDIQNFYYSIARMRVTRALRHWGYPGAGTFSKWSCVFNPIASVPRHVLPIGFVQSPLLATLVLMKSTVVEAIERAIANGVCISVYLDDFIGSHNDEEILKVAYQDIHDTCVSAGLVPNPAKLEPPSVAITAFNCELTHRMARLTEERTTKYQSRPDRTATTDAAFEQYRLLVASENALTSE